ncbi:hypothetical protein CTAYLR_004455 [Chrysophaeum taylorii]|uniref:Cytidyltransferase-like domain-containing protein n=1 Tax=Chrysophaeum taylorii TaxID=2483200 RepID=A0AAD7UCA6_9STRA|nr:hypothetical protein CTAYLR_004455 [Chrysophaeum taylorii]
MERRRVAVFGGAFDPITMGHLSVMSSILQARAADEVWVMPCGERPDKPSVVLCPWQRWLLCHLAVDSMFGRRSRVYVRDDDIRTGEPSMGTLELMRRLRREDVDLAFVIGEDLVASLPSWANASQLLAECRFLVHARPGIAQTGDLPACCERLEPPFPGAILPTVEISSTEVRSRVARAADRGELEMLLEGLVPPAVLTHILRYRLYREEKDATEHQNFVG